MSHNSRIRADLAAWALASVLTMAEIDAIDQAQFEAINGDKGGSWAPLLAIVIGGAGLEVNGDFAATNVETLHLKGAMTAFNGSEINLNSGAQVSGVAGSTVNLQGQTTLGDLISCTIKSGRTLTALVGSTVSLLGTSTFKNLGSGAGGAAFTLSTDAVGTIENNAYLALTGSAHIDLNTGTQILVKSGAALELEGVLKVNGSLTSDDTSVWTLHGSFNTDGDVILTDASKFFTSQRVLRMSGNGAGVAFRVGTLPNSNSSLNVTKDRWLVPQNLTGSRTYTIQHTTNVPVDGQTLHVSRNNTQGSGCTFEREDGTALCSFLTTSGKHSWAVFIYNAANGGWRLDSFGGAAVETAVAATY